MDSGEKNTGFLPEKEKAEKVKKLLSKNKAAALGLAVMLTVSTGLSGCYNKYNNEEDEGDDSYYTGGGYHGGYYHSSGGSYRGGSWGSSSSSGSISGSKGYSSGSSRGIGG